ncbi:hypothetical protein [uncultured Lutibacter sp.]|uniref:hypothetical protein n=1 Tax=uncultured Lutibacter sp. TaxID=437739 RepID=UPI00262D4D84|nr:hypothetical protein [uncultured Lutibacter sp.]
MKTSNWVKLIGISCIVFGSLGVIANISSLFTPQWIIETWPTISPVHLKWIERLVYLGIFVNIIYLMAGIFFLRNKPFSLILIYSALIISLLYVVIPWIFFKPFDDLIFVVIGPIIDLCLIIAVYRIRKYYYEDPDEIVKLFGEIKLDPPQLKLLTFLSVIFISIPILLQGLWIYAFSLADNQSEAVTIFHSYYPEYLHGPYTSTYISIAFCLLAIILSSISLKLSGKLWKTLNTVILIFGSLMFFLNLFQLI